MLSTRYFSPGISQTFVNQRFVELYVEDESREESQDSSTNVFGIADLYDMELTLRDVVFRPLVIATRAIESTTRASSASAKVPDAIAISPGARRAIGPAGVARLNDFTKLRANWDRAGASPLNYGSVRMFSDFFRWWTFTPRDAAIFMSLAGELVVNWPDERGELVELEFQTNSINYFIEATGEESTVAGDDIGVTSLTRKLQQPRN